MSIRKTAFGYVAVALGLIVAGAGMHVSSEPPSAKSHRSGHDLFGALGTAGSLGAGAGLCYAGYRLLVSPAKARAALERSGATRRRPDGTGDEDSAT